MGTRSGSSLASEGISYKTQCTQVPAGASGSSMISAKLSVFAGGLFHSRFGEMSCASHVNLLGITSPSEKSGFVMCSAMAPPFSGEKSPSGSNDEAERTKVTRAATMMCADISRTLLRGPVAAQKFGDFGVATLLRETEGRFSIIRLGLQIGAACQQHTHNSQVA